MTRPTVAFSFLGTTLDRGRGMKRWSRWRPTVGLCSQPDLQIDRLELLADPRHRAVSDQVVADLADVSPQTEVVLRPFALDDPWDFEGVYGSLLELAQAYPFDLDAEDYLVHITTGTHVAQICLFLLTEARFLPGRLVQTGPERGRDASVAGRHRIIDLDRSRYDTIARRFQADHRQATTFLKDGIETANPAFNRLIDEIEVVAARTRLPLLLMGPTGAGKTRLARRITDLKRARGLTKGELVEVNCATLRGDGAMSALFGHTRGAFTGAERARGGLLKRAHGGVLFLDEVGELGRDEQAMLLRALESGTFLPVGADTPSQSDFQLLVGTNRDLRAAAAQGRFRADLLARIDTWAWTLPALRDRPEDIAPNLDYELDRVARQTDRRVTFSREARDRFLAFATGPQATWDRNFRDLGAAVQRMSTLAPGGRIDPATVDAEIARLRATWAPQAAPGADAHLLRRALGARADALDPFDAVQLAHVLRVVRQTDSLAAAGRRLFAVSRREKARPNDTDRVRKYLARHGLDRDGVVSA